MPTYSEMVTEAILALKERSGSSVQAIKKHIVSSHLDLAFAPHQLRSSLKKGMETGKYIKVKNSYKLSPEARKPLPKKVVKKPVAKESPKNVKKAATTKKPAVKKTSGKGTFNKPKAVMAKKSTGGGKKSTSATKKSVNKATPAKKKTSSKKAVSKKIPLKKGATKV